MLCVKVKYLKILGPYCEEARLAYIGIRIHCDIDPDRRGRGWGVLRESGRYKRTIECCYILSVTYVTVLYYSFLY